MYGVDYRGHDFRLPGTNQADDSSYFYGHTDKQVGHLWWRHFIGDFTVRTDQHSYSIQDIKWKTDKLGLRTSTGIPNAMTDPSSPYVNAIANNAILQGSEFFGMWVYELGNSLAFISERMPEIPPDAERRYDIGGEPGAAFEDCVFGGKLGANGSISRPR